MKKLNFFVGRLQPMTQGHLNCINEGEAPCIVYRINSSNKTIERKKKGIKIGSKSWTDESVNKVIAYIDNPTGDLTEQEKELLKRPFTNELIDKELESVKKANKNILDVIPVTHVYDALGRYNAFITEHSDEYEVGDWMCGDDRKDDFEANIEKMAKYTELETELKSGKTYPNILIGKLKVNTGKGRTEGVSGTAVRKAILNKDKAAFEKIMPKGAGSLFNDFTKAFDDFKVQLQNIIKEHKMMTLKEYIIESQQSHVDDFIDFLLKNSKEGELKYNSKSYYDYFNECNPFDNPKFSLNINNTVYAEDYCEEHDIDSVEDDEENFIKYIKDIVAEQLTLELEKKLIKIERVISLNDSFSKYKGNIGIYWTFMEGMGDSHGAVGSSRNNITVCALVDPKDVNWEETIAANIIDPDEYELTLNEDAPIQITKILDVNRKLIIEKNILYKA